MKRTSWTILILVSLLVTAAPAFSQTVTTGDNGAMMVDLGPDATLRAVGMNSSGNAVVAGWTGVAPNSAPTTFTIDGNGGIIVEPCASLATAPGTAGAIGQIFAISRDGTTVGGMTTNLAGESEATLWPSNAPTAPSGIGILSPFSQSQVMDSSDNGQVLVGTLNGAAAFMWTPASGMEILSPAPSGLQSFFANAVSRDGGTIAGAVSITGGLGTGPAKWDSSSSDAQLLPDPVGFGGMASSISPNGRWIGGYVLTATSLQAAIWDTQNGDALTGVVVQPSGDPFLGHILAIADDGTAVGTDNVLNSPGTPDGGFIVIDGEAQPFSVWLATNHNIAAGPFRSVEDIYSDGTNYHFAVAGSAYYVTTRIDTTNSGGDPATVPDEVWTCLDDTRTFKTFMNDLVMRIAARYPHLEMILMYLSDHYTWRGNFFHPTLGLWRGFDDCVANNMPGDTDPDVAACVNTVASTSFFTFTDRLELGDGEEVHSALQSCEVP